MRVAGLYVPSSKVTESSATSLRATKAAEVNVAQMATAGRPKPRVVWVEDETRHALVPLHVLEEVGHARGEAQCAVVRNDRAVGRRPRARGRRWRTKPTSHR